MKGVPDRAAAREVARDLCAPLTPLRVDESRGTHDLILTGLLARAQRLMLSLVALDDAELEDCQDSLLRSMFDVVATFIWIGDDDADDSRLRLLLRTHRRDLRILFDTTGIEIFGSFLSDVGMLLKDLPAEGPEKLPPIEVRFKNHPLEKHYFRYRELARRSHGSLTAATMYLRPEDEGRKVVISPDNERRFAQNYLAYGALLLFTITVDATAKGLMTFSREDLGAAGGVLWRYWRIVEGKDAG